MFKKKSAFTLAELMVVIAIIGMLTASAMTIFSGAQAQARDSRRVSDLNTISAALDLYYNENRFYPQPALRTNENLWGFLKDEGSRATCPVEFKKDENGNITTEIDYTAIKCGGDIYKEESLVQTISCEFEEFEHEGENVSSPISIDYSEDVCDATEDDCFETPTSTLASEMEKVCKTFLQTRFDTTPLSISAEKDGDTESNKILVGWKGTLTEASGKNSIHTEDPEAPFSSYLKTQSSDPKYTASKYTDYGLGFYPYAVFRDDVGTNASKSQVGGTAFQIAATLEEQDDDGNFHPKTLIVGNYKAPRGSKGYPKSLIGTLGQDSKYYNAILNGQKEGEKVTGVSKPNGTDNRGIPYPVEEIE